MDNLFYSNEKNVLILLALLKANGIKKIIASPGATNFCFVGSIQNDPYFEVYSCVDERSAAYMACGLAAESGEPVVLTCTGSTASRDYYPGLTEAYYRKLPILAITSHQGKDRIGHLLPQNIDRSVTANDVVRFATELPVVKDDRDEYFVTIEANKAILELTRNGGGPVHINLYTSYSRDFSVKELPSVKVMHRYNAWDNLPDISASKIAVYVGAHMTFSNNQVKAIERFCATYDAFVICDHTSGYYGKYRLLPTLAHLQVNAMPPMGTLDLMIHIGEVSATTFLQSCKAKEVWRVSEDGEIRDTFKKMTNIFQMSEEFFFNHYGKEGSDKHSVIDALTSKYAEVYDSIPELPFCNIWAAQKLSERLPNGSLIHISTSNTRRCWNMFPLPDGVTSSCNVGCCGIDGCTSTLVGASLVDSKRICYIVTGDLAFFYDLNVIGNRHIGNNVRILVTNNGLGAEFRLYHHYCHTFGSDANKYMAAAGHNGNKNPHLLRNIAENLGYKYLTASTKEEYINALSEFTNPKVENSMILEIFTEPENESDALKAMTQISSDVQGALKHQVVKGIKSVAGKEGLSVVKKIFGK